MPKKGRTFQCSGFDGCSMSFTRSEHLARHIRKHTGERPFHCQHCHRSFSRLDNLRQHKQTVHVYENFVLTYPGDKITVRVKTEDLHKIENIIKNDGSESSESASVDGPDYVTESAAKVPSNQLPPPRVSEMFDHTQTFRPKENNRPQPIDIPAPIHKHLPFLTPTSSSPFSPSSPMMARPYNPQSPIIRSSFGTDLTSYSLPLTPGSDTRLPTNTKSWLTNVLNDDT
ncbi:unnamed protein product [Kuraishia capsulata CBS 1993]|uniref:C2H2-type domain-containing protein n=1 Tax=Kuraishia capsulata CBS 1993 TaxID=1382522 RepID=W6ML57_9ASCO|nr:uncharacterized protein KUCA_T00003197001 [Kuraishia capsulata CBS 1993]CDK27219.1 unnamed protein product [Kuraishia capsulata CBS 1993]